MFLNKLKLKKNIKSLHLTFPLKWRNSNNKSPGLHKRNKVIILLCTHLIEVINKFNTYFIFTYSNYLNFKPFLLIHYIQKK